MATPVMIAEVGNLLFVIPYGPFVSKENVMLYEASLGTAGTSAVVRLAGDITNRDVGALRALLDQAAAQTSRRLVIDMHDVHALSAAAVRCLAFVQQHLPATAEVVIDGASPELLERLSLAGLDRSMVIVPAGALTTV